MLNHKDQGAPLLQIKNHNSEMIEVSPICYADDSALGLALRNKWQITLLKWVLHVLSIPTGLVINPAKTKIILFGQHSLDLKIELGTLGICVKTATHLGLQISQTLDNTIKFTYEKILAKFKFAAEFYTTRCGTSNLLHKRNLIQAIISSTTLHAFRTLSPPPDTIKAMQNIIDECLFKYTFAGNQAGRKKVSKNRISAPLVKGGLNMSSVEILSYNSAISAMAANCLHSFVFPNSLLNQLTGAGKRHKVLLGRGSKYIETSTNFLGSIMPTSPTLLKYLSNTLEDIEDDPSSIFRIPLVGSIHADYFRPLNLRDIPNTDYQTVGQLVKIIKSHSGLSYVINQDLINNEFEDQRVKDKIFQFLEKIQRKFPKPPRHIKRKISDLMSAPPLLFTLFSRRFMSVKPKKLRQKKIQFIPPSFNTRIRDNVEVPRNPYVFVKAYRQLNTLKIMGPQVFFQWELLGRTLPSKNKLYKSKLAQTDQCDACPNSLANSSHQAALCTIPTFFLHILRNCPVITAKIPLFELNSLYLEFSLPFKSLDPKENSQLQDVMIRIKQLSFKAWKLDNFARWKPIILFAKILIVMQNAVQVREFAGLPVDFLQNIVAFCMENCDSFYELYRIEFSHLPAN
jgi:hypothetical protein